jgi:hypothetical protein
MAEQGEVDIQAEEGVVRIGKRCYVSNLAWRTSWQDLKVRQAGRGGRKAAWVQL